MKKVFMILAIAAFSASFTVNAAPINTTNVEVTAGDDKKKDGCDKKKEGCDKEKKSNCGDK